MRLLFICPEMPLGGAQRQWAELIPALAERGAEPMLLALAGEGPLFAAVAEAGVPAVCAGMRGPADVRGLRRALAATHWRPDAVVAYGTSAQVVGWRLAQRAAAAYAVTEHTPCVPGGRLLKGSRRQQLLTRLVAPRADLVIAVAQAQVEPLAGLGYRRERIEVIPNGLFADNARPGRPRADTREELGLGDEDFAALAVAALRPEKRIDLFVRAVADARRSNPRIRGLVAGAGRDEERVRALAEASSGAVRTLGARSDVRDLIAAADAICLPSEAEALPMSLLEGMAGALPAVATDVGGVSDAVVSGETGVVTPPGDEAAFARALLELAADPERARRLGEAGAARQRERFGGESMVDAYLEAFERLVGSARTAGAA